MADDLFADGFLAGIYDAWHPRETRNDYDFYLPSIMASQSVLDVGCGTGTLLHDARRRGHAGRLCGIDPAGGMLEQARRRSDIEWVLGQVASSDWRGEFDLAVMTGHAFQAIVSDNDVRASIAAIARALRPGGRFAFETRNPKARAWEHWRPENASAVVPAGGLEVLITTEVVTPFDGETVTFTHRFTGDHPSLPKVSRSTLRFLDLPALEAVLREAGMSIEARFGDFDGRPISETDPEIIIVARKP